MVPKAEGKALREAFWTGYGQAMRRHRSLRGPKVSWLNYNTGIKDIFFRQDADQHGVRVSIDIQHSDPSLREVYFDQFWELETLIHSMTGRTWTWERRFWSPSGHEISRIFTEEKGCSIYVQEDWPAMYLFLERTILPLDEIWVNAIDVFKDLEK